MTISTNTSAIEGSRSLAGSSACLSKPLARLSSGFKPARPDDEATGQEVAMRFDAQMSRAAAAYNGAARAAVSTTTAATGALTAVKTAISRLVADRASVGATRIRLEYTTQQLGVLKDNLAASTSRIKDTDVAEGRIAYAKYNILVQSGTAMLARASFNSQSILQLSD